MKAFSIQKCGFGRLLGFVTIILLLQGCIVSGFKSDQELSSYKPDSSLITGSVPVSAQTTDDPIIKSDQLAVRDKVSRLRSKSLNSELKWDNNLTGSEGTISAIVEKKQDGHLCRTFKTTRAAFDGVNLYHGQICELAPEIWTVTAFEIVQ